MANYFATRVLLKVAEAKAKEIGALIEQGRFDWTPYLRGKQKPPETIAEWVGRFEEHYFATRGRTPTKQTTWASDYALVYRRLPQNELLNENVLKKAIFTTSPQTRTRKRYCEALTALANFAGLECNFRELGAGYSVGKGRSRDLPTDEEIIAVREQIQSPAVRWVYSMLATYGLRPHEIFHLDTAELAEAPGGCRVLDNTKSGKRLSWPCYSHWWSDWELWDVTLPNIQVEGKTNKLLGGKISQRLVRVTVPPAGGGWVASAF